MKPPMDVSKPESDFNMEKIFRAVLVNNIIISMSDLSRTVLHVYTDIKI